MDLTKASKKELIDKCKELKIDKYSSKNKSELISLINSKNKASKEVPKLVTETPKVVTNKKNTNSFRLLHNDCLEEIKKLENESLNCVITDPPYFIDKLDSNWSSQKINEEVANSHIKHLPKGMKYDKSQVKNLYEFYLKVSKVLYEKMKPRAYFFSFSSPRLYHPIAMACEEAGFEVRDMINWVYTQSMPKGMSVNHIIDKMELSENDKNKLKEEYKDFKTPMIKSCFEPICVDMKPIKETFIKNEILYKTGLIDFSNKVGIENDRVPANIITTEEFNEIYDKNFLISKPSQKEKGDFNTHITVKPVNLMEHLIKIFSKENSIILDPFMGSGTTGVACKNLNRNFIGMKINEEYYNISKQRIL